MLRTAVLASLLSKIDLPEDLQQPAPDLFFMFLSQIRIFLGENNPGFNHFLGIKKLLQLVQSLLSQIDRIQIMESLFEDLFFLYDYLSNSSQKNQNFCKVVNHCVSLLADIFEDLFFDPDESLRYFHKNAFFLEMLLNVVRERQHTKLIDVFHKLFADFRVFLSVFHKNHGVQHECADLLDFEFIEDFSDFSDFSNDEF